MCWFDIPATPRAGQARREKAALNEMFDRYLTALWKRTFDLTFARLPDHATGDEYLARHLGSFLFGDFLPRKKQGNSPSAAAPASQDDADDASFVASSDVSSTMWDGS